MTILLDHPQPPRAVVIDI